MKHVYAMQRADGAVKIGISGDLRHRCFSLKAQTRQNVEVSYKTDIRDDARLVESVAHRLLKDKQHLGEWFWVSVEEATAAISHAVDIIEGRMPDVTADAWFSPSKRTGPTEKTERLNLTAEPEFIRMLDDWRRRQPDLPSRSEALRRTSMKTLRDELGEE